MLGPAGWWVLPVVCCKDFSLQVLLVLFASVWAGDADVINICMREPVGSGLIFAVASVCMLQRTVRYCSIDAGGGSGLGEGCYW